ncbi:MAG: asparagine--tRNA ligase [Chloroflexota bacterium]
MRVRVALAPESVGLHAQVEGWVRTKRESKSGVTFVEINDGSSLKNLQVVVPDAAAAQSVMSAVTTGASVVVRGEVIASPAAGQATELRASEVEVIGSAEEYPLAKKRHSFEYLRSQSHLRHRTNTFGAVARVRNEVCRSIHAYFQERGYLYVQTPIITGTDAEGAGEMFQVTSLDLNQLSRQEGLVDFSQDLFGKPTYLAVSGQLEAEMMATALGSVYTFGPTFRAENSNTARHLAEFWMVEPEIAFCDLSSLGDVAEEFLKTIFSDVLRNCPEDMAFFDERVQSGVIERLQRIVESTFARVTYTEAIELLQQSGKSFEFPPAWGKDLQAEHERYLSETEFGRPVIVTDYPTSIKAFYMRLNRDGKTVAAMDVLAPEVGEIIGGSQREERYDVLLERMKGMGIDPDEYWWYLDLRKYGTVPHSGFGLGLERTVRFITGMQNIRDVIPFPRAPGSAEF